MQLNIFCGGKHAHLGFNQGSFKTFPKILQTKGCTPLNSALPCGLLFIILQPYFILEPKTFDCGFESFK